MTKPIVAKDPARICFFGDHQDYLKLPVIAGTINRYIQVEGQRTIEPDFNFYLTDIQKYKLINLNNKANNILDGDYYH